MDLRRQRAAWAAVIVAGVLLTFAPAVVGVRTLSQRDTDRLYAPVRTLVVEELRAGRLPLWNPYEGTGKPLFAEGVHSVLHPISLAAAVLVPTSIDFLILSYLVAAALGAFVLATTLGTSPPASAGAGLAFALSGYSVSMTGNLVFLAGLSTLPWLVAAARSAGAGNPWGPVGAALATACAFLSGDAQTALVGLALGMVLAARANGARGVARAGAAMAAGVLLAGVQIVATHELIPLTFRSLELPDFQKTQWALTPGRLLEWIVPGLVRGPLSEDLVSASGILLAPPFAESVYLGAPLLVAAAIGLRDRPRAGRVLGIAGVVLLWLALGHLLGARQLLEWVPVWSRFRYSEKLMAPITLCVCALAALGVDAFGVRRLSKAWTSALTLAAGVSGSALFVLLIAPAATREFATRFLGDAGPFYRSTLAAGLPHLVVGLGALLSVNRLRHDVARASAISLLVALASAAAVYYGAHLGSPDLRRFSTAMRLGADTPTPRIVHLDDRMYDAHDPAGPIDATARIESLFLGPAINVASRVDTIDTYGRFRPLRVTDLVMSFGDGWGRAIYRFGVTHVVAQLVGREAYAVAIEGGRLVQRDERLGFEVWAMTHRPWAFFARRAVTAATPENARGALLDLATRGDDDTVVVETPESPRTAPGRVLHVERGTRSVRVEAESLEQALLVVQDAYWPGWRATIDGQPAEVLAADYLVRAVRWPPGRHRLEMTYDPPEIRFGLALSALGAVLVLLLAALAARRRPIDSGTQP